MSDFFTRLTLYLAEIFSNIPSQLRAFRYLILFIFIVLTAFFAAGLPKFQLDSSIETWLHEGDPSVKALENFKKQFGGDDGVYIVYKAKDGDVFSPQSLTKLRDLTNDLENWENIKSFKLNLSDEQLKGFNRITDIQSLANERYEIDDGESLLSKNIIPIKEEIDNSLAKKIFEISINQKHLNLLFFSKSKVYGAILLKTDFGTIPVDLELNASQESEIEVDELDKALNNFDLEIDAAVENSEIKYKNTQPSDYTDLMLPLNKLLQDEKYSSVFDFYLVGTAPLTDMAYEIMSQAGILVIISLLIIIIFLFSLFNSGSAVIWTVTCIVSSCIWLVGGMAWLGIPSTTLIMLTVVLVLGIGIADCVHVLNGYTFFQENNLDHHSTIKLAYKKTGVPILLTSITTMAAMSMIAFGGVQHFVTFGITSALGVFLAFVFTIVILPVLMDFWHPSFPVKSKNVNQNHYKYISYVIYVFQKFNKLIKLLGIYWFLTAAWLPKLLSRVPTFSYRFRYFIIVFFLFLLAVCSVGISKVKLDSNIIELFKEGTKIRETYNIVDKEMSGTGSMEIMINLKVSDGFTDVSVLKALSELQDLMEQKYSSHVVRTYSLTDIVKNLNKTLGDGSKENYNLPKNSIAVSQLLSLLNNSNPEKRRKIVTDDFSQSHITIQLRNASSNVYSELFKHLESDLAKILEPLRLNYPQMEYGVTGTFALLLRLADIMSYSQFKSLSLAVVVISLILLITLGSVSGGILAIIPNILPTISSFGLMGLMGIPLDADTLLIAPLIIGIAVDDTIHFVSHYRMNLAQGNNFNDALKNTVDQVGRAVTFTTLILGVSFLMLGFSDHLGIARVGIFGSFAIFIALLCDLLFLPALIHVFKPKYGITKVLT